MREILDSFLLYPLTFKPYFCFSYHAFISFIAVSISDRDIDSMSVLCILIIPLCMYYTTNSKCVHERCNWNATRELIVCKMGNMSNCVAFVALLDIQYVTQVGQTNIGCAFLHSFSKGAALRSCIQVAKRRLYARFFRLSSSFIPCVPPARRVIHS